MSAPADPADYRGQRIALLTQHGKERVIAPRVRQWPGAEVEHVAGYDTDQLGTFTREIPRGGTQLEAAQGCVALGRPLILPPPSQSARLTPTRSSRAACR